MKILELILYPFIWLLNMLASLLFSKRILKIMNSEYIYNLSWEDPRIDNKVYGPFKNKNVTMITTGGDNVLDYLIEDVAHIDTFDMNKHQNYLLELKMACIAALDQEETFRIFAKRDGALFRQKWHLIQPYLTEGAQNWWSNNLDIMDYFLYSGSVSIPASLIWYAIRLLGLSRMLHSINQHRTLEHQRKMYQKYRGRIQLFAKTFDNLKNVLKAYVGVPQRQLDLLESPYHLSEVVEYMFMETNLAKDNYFYWGYLYGEWNEECCPRYLKAEHYATVRDRLNRITIHTDLLGEFKEAQEYKTDIYILLDHMDWLEDRDVAKEIHLLRQNAAPNCKYCWRSAASRQPFGCLDAAKFLCSDTIGRKSPNKFSDRVAMYDSIHVARFPQPLMLAKDISYASTWIDDAKTQFKMFSHPAKEYAKKLLNTRGFEIDNQGFLESFYEDQASSYDNFRSRMLHGKRELMHMLPIKPNTSLCVFAGGTGDVLEYIADSVPNLSDVCVMDICEPLLKKSMERVEKHGWRNVESVVGDAHTFVQPNRYDYVVITYSLSMIPDWKAALTNAIASLKPGGYLAVSDFTVHDQQSNLSRKLWKKWFSFDRVHLSEDHRKEIGSRLEVVREVVGEGTFPNVPSIIKCPYYCGLYKKAQGLEHKFT